MSLANCKKGNMADIVWIMGIVFASMIFLVILYYTWTELSPQLESTLNKHIPEGETSINITSTHDKISAGVLSFNSILPLFILGLFATVIIAAFFIQSHPAFFFIAILFLLIVVVIAVVFSNVYQTITETESMAASAAEFTFSNLFMEYLPYIILIFAAAILIVLFAKPFIGGNPGY